MVISVRLISSEKMTEVMLCLIDADRAMSSPRVELWVRDHRATGEVEVVVAVDLDAAHRHRLDAAGRR